MLFLLCGHFPYKQMTKLQVYHCLMGPLNSQDYSMSPEFGCNRTHRMTPSAETEGWKKTVDILSVIKINKLPENQIVKQFSHDILKFLHYLYYCIHNLD